jgi:hypothetical protein
MAKNLKSLKDRAKEFSILLPFMENKEKGDMERLQGGTFTINEYGFLKDTSKGKEKEYVCFTVKEDPQNFYFGGQVLTENLKQLEDEGYHETIVKEGLPTLFEKKKSKNKDPETGIFMTYTNTTFFPEA